MMQKNQDLRLLLKFVYWLSIVGIFSLVGYIGWLILITID